MTYKTNHILSKKTVVSNIITYGITHALIDATCAATIYSISASAEQFLLMIVLYNVLAFAFQPFIGLLSDYFKKPRTTAIIGIIITIISAPLFFIAPWLATILAGLGNATYHIGSGTISLNLTPRKATAPGIVVAFGAIGLLIGTLIGKIGLFVPMILAIFIVLLIISIIIILLIPKIQIDYEKKRIKSKDYKFLDIILILVLTVIAARSFIGSTLIFPWKGNMTLLFVLTLGVFLGKALGGVIGDKYGWIKISVGSMLISIPLLMFVNYPVLNIIGMFLFNMTMPITLVALSNMIPGRPGYAFGLNCLALMIGFLPSLIGVKISNTPIIIALVLVVTASILWKSLEFHDGITYSKKTAR